MSNDLQNHVDHIANLINTGDWTNGRTTEDFDSEEEFEDANTAWAWVSDVLDIEWIVSSDRKTLLGASLLVSFGGPNIWVNTRSGRVMGSWWGESASAPLVNGEELEQACEELFECL